jgi:hypothetical protein
MCNQAIVKVFSAVLLALLSIIVDGMFLAPLASAQSQPFLITPYYGAKTIRSNFDHQRPYATDNYLLGFNGGYRAPAAVNNCTNGINGSCYDSHDGIDFAMDYEPVLATGRGVVTRVGWWDPNVRTSSFGLTVEIQHGDNGSYITRYAHLSAVAVIYGQTVEAGQIIGTSGSTGNSTGAHLHFGLLTSDRRPIDPFGWTGGFADPWSQDPLGATSYCLWADGEWANYCGRVSRLIPAPVDGGQKQIDDNTTNANGFSKGSGGLGANSCTGSCGNWTRENDLYWTNDNDMTVDSWAGWATPTSSPGGSTIYEIQVFIPVVNALPEAQTTWYARYQINHADDTTYAYIDQRGSRGRWISIGVYRMYPVILSTWPMPLARLVSSEDLAPMPYDLCGVGRSICRTSGATTTGGVPGWSCATMAGAMHTRSSGSSRATARFPALSGRPSPLISRLR